MSDGTACPSTSAMPYLDLVGIEVIANEPGAVEGLLPWATLALPSLVSCTAG
jgi:hypothetical protein